LNYDYYIDKFEVSNKQYSEFCPDCARPSDPWWSPNYSSNYPDHPVVGVSWNEAKTYCEKVGKGLPTEIEWEKAASWTPDATDDSRKWKRRWPWGEPFDASRVNLGSKHTTPVGQYEKGASAYGVYNLAANASEWVADTYSAYPGSQFRDPDFGSGKRVVRGGSFRSDGEAWLRTTSRVAEPPVPSQEAKIKRSWLIGFRCTVPGSNAALQEHLKRTGQMK
jgi:formylglycine-generating enzyme required for sulfatase activity